jgi:hypothetical protein
MNPNFSTTFKTFAFSPEILGALPDLIANYGRPAMDGNLEVITIAAGWDDSEKTRIRALRFPETVSLTELTDGRYAYTALWTIPLLEAYDRGEFAGVSELTEVELQGLIPVIEEPIVQEPIVQEQESEVTSL